MSLLRVQQHVYNFKKCQWANTKYEEGTQSICNVKRYENVCVCEWVLCYLALKTRIQFSASHLESKLLSNSLNKRTHQDKVLVLQYFHFHFERLFFLLKEKNNSTAFLSITRNVETRFTLLYTLMQTHEISHKRNFGDRVTNRWVEKSNLLLIPSNAHAKLITRKRQMKAIRKHHFSTNFYKNSFTRLWDKNWWLLLPPTMLYADRSKRQPETESLKILERFLLRDDHHWLFMTSSRQSIIKCVCVCETLLLIHEIRQ